MRKSFDLHGYCVAKSVFKIKPAFNGLTFDRSFIMRVYSMKVIEVWMS